MAKNEVVYTDGHDIVVTPSELKVRKTRYNLPGILRHGMVVIHPWRMVGTLIVMLGMGLFFFGIICFLTPLNVTVFIAGGPFSIGQLCMLSGSAIALIGVLVVFLSTERYAVRLVTAEGEVNAVVSRRREYILQILNALGRAFRLSNLRRSQLTRTTHI